MTAKVSRMSSRRSTKRKATYRRKKPAYRVGHWNILGVFHGGKEGKQWQRGKRIVAWCHAMVKWYKQQTTVGIGQAKARAMEKINKLAKLSKEDRMRLISEIERL